MSTAIHGAGLSRPLVSQRPRLRPNTSHVQGSWAALPAARAVRAAALFCAGAFAAPILSCDGALLSRNAAPAAHADAGADARGGEASAALLLPGGHTIADVAARVTPSVVSVFSEHGPQSLSGQEDHPFFSDPFFEFFFRRRGGPVPRGAPRSLEQSLGSGVIVASDGLIMTNHHVIADAAKIRVALKDGRELDAKLVGTDPKSDLALLRVSEKQLPAIPMADSSKLRTGDLVLAVGSPFGLGQTVTMGIVSAVGRANMGITDYEDFIQTDAAINPGNSGGALVTMDGRLAGINTAIVSRSGGYQGIGFAIPSRMALQIKDALLRDGKVVRGWLGVAIQDLTPDMARALGVEPGAGVLVSDVTPGSPADKSGLKRGDVIARFDQEKPKDSSQLRRMVAEAGRGKQVALELLRGGKTQRLEVKLGEQPSDEQPLVASADGAKLEPLAGVEVRDLDRASRASLRLPAELQGVLVTEVEPSSPAASVGLRAGDVIVEANRVSTPSSAALRSALAREPSRSLLLVYREGATIFMLVPR
jgi:serine protease Do